MGILALLLALPTLLCVEAAGETVLRDLNPSEMTTFQEKFDFALTISPLSAVIPAGKFAVFTLEAKSTSRILQLINLSIAGLPRDSVGSFSEISGIPNPVFSSTLIVTTSFSTPMGSYDIEIRGASKDTTRTSTVSLVVAAAPPPDFTISLSPDSRSVVQGGSTEYTATIVVTGPLSEKILLTLRLEGLPVGVVGRLDPDSFDPTPRVMSLTSTLYVSTNSSTMTGDYMIHVVGTSSGLAHQGDTRLTVEYSDPWKQTWQTLSNLSDIVKVAIIGAAAAIIAAIIEALWKRPNEHKPKPTGRRQKKVKRTMEPPILSRQPSGHRWD